MLLVLLLLLALCLWLWLLLLLLWLKGSHVGELIHGFSQVELGEGIVFVTREVIIVGSERLCGMLDGVRVNMR